MYLFLSLFGEPPTDSAPCINIEAYEKEVTSRYYRILYLFVAMLNGKGMRAILESL